MATPEGQDDLTASAFHRNLPKGAERRGTDEDGKPWVVTMPRTTDSFLGPLANDGDHGVDVFIGPKPEAGILGRQPEQGRLSKHDEPKVMLGYESAESAQADYLRRSPETLAGVFGPMVAYLFDRNWQETAEDEAQQAR